MTGLFTYASKEWMYVRKDMLNLQKKVFAEMKKPANEREYTMDELATMYSISERVLSIPERVENEELILEA